MYRAQLFVVVDFLFVTGLHVFHDNNVVVVVVDAAAAADDDVDGEVMMTMMWQPRSRVTERHVAAA